MQAPPIGMYLGTQLGDSLAGGRSIRSKLHIMCPEIPAGINVSGAVSPGTIISPRTSLQLRRVVRRSSGPWHVLRGGFRARAVVVPACRNWLQRHWPGLVVRCAGGGSVREAAAPWTLCSIDRASWLSTCAIASKSDAIPLFKARRSKYQCWNDIELHLLYFSAYEHATPQRWNDCFLRRMEIRDQSHLSITANVWEIQTYARLLDLPTHKSSPWGFSYRAAV